MADAFQVVRVNAAAIFPYQKVKVGKLGIQGPAGGSADSDPRKLLFLAREGGPYEGFPTAYREIEDSYFPTYEIWYVDATKTKKIVSLDTTWTGILVTQEVVKAYAADGVTVIATTTDIITYSGVKEVARTRVTS